MADEIARDGQQVVEWQQQGTPQVSMTVSCVGARGLHAMGRVQAIGKDIALFPLADLLLGDAKALGQQAGCLLLAALSTFTAGVVRAFLCKAI